MTTPADRPAGAVAPEADARAIAAVVETLPDVALHGASGAGTFLRGEWVPGVRVRPGRVELHVAVRWPRPVLAAAEAVRSAVAPLAPGPVDVVVADVTEDEGPARAPLPPSPPRRPAGGARAGAPLPVEGTP